MEPGDTADDDPSTSTREGVRITAIYMNKA